MRHRTPLWVGVVRKFTLGVFGGEVADISGIQLVYVET